MRSLLSPEACGKIAPCCHFRTGPLFLSCPMRYLSHFTRIRIWLDPRALDRLDELRRPTESYSDVIVRIGGAVPEV
jgi:hypothetical protein